MRELEQEDKMMELGELEGNMRDSEVNMRELLVNMRELEVNWKELGDNIRELGESMRERENRDSTTTSCMMREVESGSLFSVGQSRLLSYTEVLVKLKYLSLSVCLSSGET